jgi:hypothetical protein
MNINTAIKIMKEKVSDSYAQGYLNKIPEAIEKDGTKGLCVQLTYIMENVKMWRGDEAREIKAFVKEWVKEKGNNIDDN